MCRFCRRRSTVTSKLDSGIKVEEQLAVIAFFGIALFALLRDNLFSFIDETKLFLDNSWRFIVNLGLFLVTPKGLLLTLAILSPLIFYFNYRLSIALSTKLWKRRTALKRLEEQETVIKQLLRSDLEKLDIHQVVRYIRTIQKERHGLRSAHFEKYSKELSEKLEKAQRFHELLKHKSEIGAYEYQKKNYKELLEILEKQRRRYEKDGRTEKREIMYKLRAEDTNVFYREELKDDELHVLKEQGYKQVNEYDLFSQSVRTFLVKSPLNHSSTHTFLVWSVKKLVEDIKGTEKVEEHITRDADITFRYKKKYYALEIETGNLLTKKDQLKAKIAMLNRKYGKRWAFVVSNKELLPQYRKWGSSTQRTEVEKMLTKWLE